jgi:hypothetical protein
MRLRVAVCIHATSSVCCCTWSSPRHCRCYPPATVPSAESALPTSSMYARTCCMYFCVAAMNWKGTGRGTAHFEPSTRALPNACASRLCLYVYILQWRSRTLNTTSGWSSPITLCVGARSRWSCARRARIVESSASGKPLGIAGSGCRLRTVAGLIRIDLIATCPFCC